LVTCVNNKAVLLIHFLLKYMPKYVIILMLSRRMARQAEAFIEVYYLITIKERENTGKVLLFSPEGEWVHLFCMEGNKNEKKK